MAVMYLQSLTLWFLLVSLFNIAGASGCMRDTKVEGWWLGGESFWSSGCAKVMAGGALAITAIFTLIVLSS